MLMTITNIREKLNKEINMSKKHKQFWQTPDFKKTQSKWYAKLKKSGFVDLERASEKTFEGATTPYLTPSLHYIRLKLDVNVQNYYRAARAFLYHSKFKDKKLRFLWRLHVQGYSYRNMIPLLMEKFGEYHSIFWISKRINELRSESSKFNRKSKNGITSEDDSGLDKFIESNGNFRND